MASDPGSEIARPRNRFVSTRLGVRLELVKRFASHTEFGQALRGSGLTLFRGCVLCKPKAVAILPSSNSIWQHMTVLRQHESKECEPANEVVDLGLGAAARARKNEVCRPGRIHRHPFVCPRRLPSLFVASHVSRSQACPTPVQTPLLACLLPGIRILCTWHWLPQVGGKSHRHVWSRRSG